MKMNRNKKIGIHSEEGKRRISHAVSVRLKGKKKDMIHKKKIAESMKKIKIRSQCNIKSSRWIFKILIPAVHETIPLDLRDQCTVDQFRSLNAEDKKSVQILS